MNNLLEARHQIESLIAGNAQSLDELFRLRAKLGEADHSLNATDTRFTDKKYGTGTLKTPSPKTNGK